MKNVVIKLFFVAVLSVLATSHAFSQSNQQAKETEETKSSQVVEEMPVFPGGEKALVAYLKENLKYPSVPAENGVQGRVIVLFKVEADGSLTDVRIGRSVDPWIDREALRLVKAMPKWIPGKQDGKPVPVKFQVSITFSLN
ncbi:energy transducer TonB [Prevotella sp.]|uniref:energy transducer TonB n=1 Tax=Prevotella sp. TaxID=59823 RepID=UPI003079B2D3